MEDFSCARCADSLEEFDVGGISLDQCPQCGGLFFESSDLAKVLTEGKPATRPEGDANCPRCRIPMDRLPPGVPGGFSYDLCTTCHGLWLGSSELDRFKKIRNLVAPEGGKEADGKRLRAAAILEQIEGLMTQVDRQRLDRLSRLEKLMTLGMSDTREMRSIRTVVEAEAKVARQALTASPLFEEARRLCIGGFITGAQFESIRERLGA